ncbi:unnamed protein product [Closterium sp. NIES-54]
MRQRPAPAPSADAIAPRFEPLRTAHLTVASYPTHPPIVPTAAAVFAPAVGRKGGGGVLGVVAVNYNNDILLFSESAAMIERVEEMLEMQFKCSKMGDVKYYLGMHVERDLDKEVLRLHQRKYCEGLAEKYGLQDGGKPATPLPLGFTVEPCADEEVVGESDRNLFHSMVGALNYAANHTRPDIAFATSRLASVVSRPSHEQLEAAKRLVRYVSATTYVGLEYSAMRQRQQWGATDLGKGEMLLTCYTDASFNSVKVDGTSIGGYVCLFGDPLLPEGPAPSGVSRVFPLPGTAPVEVAVGSGAAPGAASGGAASRGAEPGGAGSGGAEPGGAEPEGVEPGGAESEGAESGGAEPRGATSSGGAGDTGGGDAGVTAGAGGTGGTAAPEPGGARTRGARAAGIGGVGGAGAGDPMEPRAAGAGGSCAGGAGAGGAGAGGAGVGGTGAGSAGAGGAGAVDPGAGGAGGPPSNGLTTPLLCPPPDQTQPSLQPASPLPAPSPYTEHSGSLTEHREPASRPVLPVRTTRHVPRSRPPPVPDTHAMALRPSSVPLRDPLLAPPESSLPKVPNPESDRARVARPIVSRLLATAVTDPSFESAAASALVAELLDFAAACRQDYASALVDESAFASPPSVEGECALGTDVLEDMQEDFECLAAAVPRFASMLLAPEGDPDAPDIPTPRSYAEAITGPYSSQWQAAMDAEMASRRSKGTYVDVVPPPGANIVDGMWIFRVKRPPGSPPAFKARYVARGFCQTTLAALGFSLDTADSSLFLRTDTSLPPFYVVVYANDLVVATADTEALTLVKSELQKRHTCTDLGELRSYLVLHITWDRARRTITLTQSHMVH